MHIFLTGASGFVGKALLSACLQRRYSVTALTRNKHTARQQLGSVLFSQVNWLENIDDLAINDIDAVVNLAGEPIFARRWTAAQKANLWQSRIALTSALVQKINQSRTPPNVFISASAMGFYGDVPLGEIRENTPAGDDFAARLCQVWEQTALQANTRVCLARFGLVLDPKGGILQKILPLYRWGLGGNVGSGRQYWAWIALQDAVNALLFLLENPSLSGAFNVVAPQAVTNAAFNRALAAFCQRPAYCFQPALLLKILLGERSQLLLASQKAQPYALLQAGFHFQYPILHSYFDHLSKES